MNETKLHTSDHESIQLNCIQVRGQYLPQQHPKLHMQRYWRQPIRPQDPPTPKQYYTPKRTDSGYLQHDRGYANYILTTKSPTYQTRKKSNYPETPTSLRTRRGIDSMINLYLSPDNTSIICEGLTEGTNGGKLC